MTETLSVRGTEAQNASMPYPVEFSERVGDTEDGVGHSAGVQIFGARGGPCPRNTVLAAGCGLKVFFSIAANLELTIIRSLG